MSETQIIFMVNGEASEYLESQGIDMEWLWTTVHRFLTFLNKYDRSYGYYYGSYSYLMYTLESALENDGDLGIEGIFHYYSSFYFVDI